MTNVIINGSRGRMGQALVACAQRMEDVRVVGLVDQGDDLKKISGAGQVVIDFSFREVTADVVRFCAERNMACVIGTTGHTDLEKEKIRSEGQGIPIVWASNYSSGVNALFWLTRKAAEILGLGFDLEVLEMHHRLKKDAPSGTAHSLAEILAQVRGQQLQEVSRHGREGLVGERTSTEIGIHSVRGGDVVGDHTVIFAAAGERLELTHKASSRETFANGALRAACWVVNQKPAIYDMQAVLGLK